MAHITIVWRKQLLNPAWNIQLRTRPKSALFRFKKVPRLPFLSESASRQASRHPSEFFCRAHGGSAHPEAFQHYLRLYCLEIESWLKQWPPPRSWRPPQGCRIEVESQRLQADPAVRSSTTHVQSSHAHFAHQGPHQHWIRIPGANPSILSESQRPQLQRCEPELGLVRSSGFFSGSSLCSYCHPKVLQSDGTHTLPF